MFNYIDSYLHGNKIGVLVIFSCTDEFSFNTKQFKDLSKNIGMHIAASRPKSIDYESLDPIFINKELSYTRNSIEDLSPDERLRAMDKAIKNIKRDYCLLDQPFIINPETTVLEEILRVSAELGVTIEITDYKRLEAS